MRKIIAKVFLMTCLLAGAAMLSLYPVRAQADDFQEIQAVSSQELSSMRGGFTTDSGLVVSFGIEMAAYINGVLKATNSINVANIGGGAGQPYSVQTSGNPVIVVQNGPNNFMPNNYGNLQHGIIVQNTLDQQVLKTVNTINATVNVLGLYRDMNMGNALNQQLIRSIR